MPREIGLAALRGDQCMRDHTKRVGLGRDHGGMTRGARGIAGEIGGEEEEKVLPHRANQNDARGLPDDPRPAFLLAKRNEH